MQDVRRWCWRTISLWIVGGLIVLALTLLTILTFFPWSSAKGLVEDRASATLGRRVTIGTINRVSAVSLHPTIAVRDIRIPQASWAGSGQLATIREVRVGFPLLPLLIGHFQAEALKVSGMRLDLVRDRNGRESWRREQGPSGEDSRPSIQSLTIAESQVSYRDARRDRSFTATLMADSRAGLRLSGTGTIHGEPVLLSIAGAPIVGTTANGRWPFRAKVEGPAVGMTLDGTADGPLDIRHIRGKTTGHARDLALLDALIEAGLPGTQPVRLTADVARDGRDWTVTNLKGTIGRSDIAGHATIVKRDGRTRIEGAVNANRFDFDDLSSDKGKRIAAAKRARFGNRVIPDTAIDLTRVRRTDGTLDLIVRQLLWPGSSPFRDLRGRLSLDHGHLTLDPLTLRLTRGRMQGRISVVQKADGPLLTVAMDVVQARLIDFFPDAQVDAALRGRIALTGSGRTIRLAIGRSSGTVGFAAQNGVIPARTASLLGQDVGRGLTTDADRLATLRCMGVRLNVQGGTARADPIVIDTSRATTRATGTIDLRSEGLNLMLNGAPKQASLLRFSDAIPVRGTVTSPDIVVPENAKSVGGLLRMIGRAIGGKQGALASDVNCPALVAQVMR